jgi:hypothetical protein
MSTEVSCQVSGPTQPLQHVPQFQLGEQDRFWDMLLQLVQAVSPR